MGKGSSMSIWRCLGLILAFLSLSGQTGAAKYEVGQVWEYRPRPQDAGSLLKIQQIGLDGSKKVYHISVIGVHFSTPGAAGFLPHLPVSAETLVASVTRQMPSTTAFPSLLFEAGIAEWQKAKGGVFTVPMSEIVAYVDEVIGRSKQGKGAPPTSQ